MNDTPKNPIYVPNNDLKETFADGVAVVGFDGHNVRIELSVSRVGQNKSGRETTLHPAARLVLPLNVAGDLLQKLGGAFADLEKQGVVKKGPSSGQPDSTRN